MTSSNQFIAIHLPILTIKPKHNFGQCCVDDSFWGKIKLTFQLQLNFAMSKGMICLVADNYNSWNPHPCWDLRGTANSLWYFEIFLQIFKHNMGWDSYPFDELWLSIGQHANDFPCLAWPRPHHHWKHFAIEKETLLHSFVCIVFKMSLSLISCCVLSAILLPYQIHWLHYCAA